MKKNQGYPFNAPGNVFLNEEVLAECKQLMALEGKGTVDELGFGDLYDSLAKTLFPWCSTLTSRARYFFFSVSAIELTLRRTIHPLSNNEGLDDSAIFEKAEFLSNRFASELRKMEKYLALSLYAKYQRPREGIFGYIKVSRWFREDQLTAQHRRILSIDGRYPNAIYRGSSRELGIFEPGQSRTLAMISARLRGSTPFAEEWTAACHSAIYELEQLHEYWVRAEEEGLTANEAISTLVKKNWFTENFSGFELKSDEAEFLFEKISARSPYWEHVPQNALRSLLKGDEINLEALHSMIPSSQGEWKSLIEAAIHIDRVTRHFRQIYAVRSAKGIDTAVKLAIDIESVRSSWKWLQHRTKEASALDDWSHIWTSFLADLIDSWLKCLERHRKVSPELIELLERRATDVVEVRGKKPPHLKTKKDISENDISEEIEFVESSFRLSNAARIVRDVLRGTG